MLDAVFIFTQGGLLLWSSVFKSSDALDFLIEQLKTEIVKDNTFTFGDLLIKYLIDNELVFVVVYNKILVLHYIDTLLISMKDAFLDLYDAQTFVDFDSLFNSLLTAQANKRPQQQPKKFPKGKKHKETNAKDSTSNALDYSQPAPEMKANEKLFKKTTKAPEKKSLGFLNSLTKLFTSKTEDVIPKIKEHLIQKNVAYEVAQYICNNIATKISANEQTKSIKAAFRQTILTILSSKSMDLLNDISICKDKPYVITFVGVNGVGKSTNLSKLCFHLLNNQKSILIAACDTFRSGAVEQLKTHVNNLGSLGRLELYHQGYGKDAANIAKYAIKYAKENGFDVVLIDTAGRMQDNEPLMRSLAKLVTVNNPHKIFFVGEALVGNEAVDQLTKFNMALRNYSGVANPREIDGMILTKFDTIDDKVGAAVTMTYVTGKPIVFVGVGQGYADLEKLDVDRVVDTLLS